MTSFLKQRWVLLLVLLVFICFKIPHLFYPFYCDEGWVYAPAIKTMAINGPSLMPGTIPEVYSRGHPLFFHFLCGVWIRCFGDSNVAVHSFSLLVSVLFLIALYECCLRMFGMRVAVLVLLLVPTQIIFFVQASFMYPEMLVAILAFLSLYFYAKDKLWLTALMLSMLFYSKEGGLIFGAVIGIHALVSLFRSTDGIRLRLFRLAAVMAPTLLIALFFVVQKAKLGWYLLPEHTGMIETEWSAYYFMFRRVLYWAFRGDTARYALIFFVIALSIVPAVKRRNIGYLALCLPAVLVYFLADKFGPVHTGDAVCLGLFIVFSGLVVWHILSFNKSMSVPARRFIVISGISVVAFLLYSSLSQVADRYLLVVVVLVAVLLAVCIGTYIAAVGNYLYYTAIAGILLIGVYAVYSDEGYNDTDLGGFDAMKVQMNTVSYLEKESAYDKEISAACLWEMVHFTDTLEGFLSSGRVFTRITHYPVAPTAEYAIFDNICGSDEYDRILKNPGFHLVYRTERGKMWSEIFKRK